MFHKWVVEGCSNFFFQGSPPYGSGGEHVYLLLRHDQFVGVVGGNILNGDHLDKIVAALAGDGSGGGKANEGGLRIDATLLFHEHVICLQRIVVRQGRTNKKRSDKAIPAATNGDDPSRVCPPLRVERVAGEGIPHAVEMRDDRRGRQTCADCSPSLRRLGHLPSPRCGDQLPNSPNIPSPQMPGWARQGR